MRIHTDTLTRNDLEAALPEGVYAYITPHGSRKRARAFEVTLYVLGKDSLHRRFGNSGQYGNAEDVAATWDEWGIWIARLFEIDPEVTFPGYYNDRDEFYAETERWAGVVAADHKPGSLAVRTHTAPWLGVTA